MFECKAYFCDGRVYIGKSSYPHNEILTVILNHPAKRLETMVTELRDLRSKVQLQEGGDEDYCDNYDRHVQQTQNLLYRIGGLAKKIPPYNKLGITNTVDTPLLFDCLNKHYLYWDDGKELGCIDDPRYKDEDYANEYGFVIKNDVGNYGFYNHHFFPEWSDLDDPDAETMLDMQETNEAVCKLLDSFLTFAEDLLRVQTAYTELLDDYIHAKRKFLTDSEAAECFATYLQKTAKKPPTERVAASGAMHLCYEVFRLPDGTERLCEAYEFETLGAFLYVDLFRGLSGSHVPKRCDNCGRYFLLPGGKYSGYCERPLKDEPGKTCRDVGARKRYDDKCKTAPIWLAYNRAYKAHYARYMKKKMTTAQFEQWSRYAVELREQAEREELALAEYQRLLKI